MSFIKKSVAPPDIKEGEVLKAKILEMTFPKEGKYGLQIEWSVELENGYRTRLWTKYYKEPSDLSILGRLCLTYLEATKAVFNSVNEVLEEIRRHGKVNVLCKGFREANGTLYPKFQISASKIPDLGTPTPVATTF